MGVINARFVKPLGSRDDPAGRPSSAVCGDRGRGLLPGGFGTAVLEAACDAGLDTSRVRRLGVPDQFIEHGGRDQLLAELKLDRDGIAQTCREMAATDRLTPKAALKAR